MEFGQVVPEEEEEEKDEDEEEPEEDPRQHFWKNFGIALLLMLGGTLIVAVFSDPMVRLHNVAFIALRLKHNPQSTIRPPTIQQHQASVSVIISSPSMSPVCVN